MKTETSKQPKKSKPAVELKDIKPKGEAKGGKAVLHVRKPWGGIENLG